VLKWCYVFLGDLGGGGEQGHPSGPSIFYVFEKLVGCKKYGNNIINEKDKED